MTTAGDQINAALRLLGFLDESEVPSGNVAQNCLQALNQMIDAWSIARLSVFATQEQVLTWTGGNASQTLGPSGDMIGLRPVRLLPDTYFTIGSESYPVQIISRDRYNALHNKTVASSIPEVLVVNYDAPDATLTLYPAPSQSLEFHFISVAELAQPAEYTTELVVPPGYLRAFKYNLAVELAAEVGREPPPTVQRIAASSLRAIKRANVRPEDLVMSLPYPLASMRSNILTGC